MKDKSKRLPVADQIRKGLEEAIRHAKGEITLKTTTLEMPDRPPEVGAEELTKLRLKSGMSQSVFAQVLNVSTKTVQSWEQGQRKPSQAARRHSPGLTGVYERQLPDGWQTNLYNYRVVRLWEEDAESYLTGGFNLVPLAPLADVAAEALPGLVRRMAARINSEARARADKLWTATFLLMGLRYSDELASQLLEGVQDMKESTTYQAILREGRVSEAQRLLLLQGEIRFGSPDERILGDIDAIRDIEHLESLSRRVVDTNVRDWVELLRTP